MIKKTLQFLITTLILAFIGLVATLVGTPSSSGTTQGDPYVPGLLLFLFSPVIAGAWIYIQVQRAKSAERSKAVEEQKAREKEELEKQENDRKRARFLERQRFLDAVDLHRVALTRNLDRAIKKNDYGAILVDTTEDALAEFIASIDLDKSLIDVSEARDLVFEQLDLGKRRAIAGGFDANDIPIDGHSFEKWVAEALQGFGWQAEVTRGSGDQGIDVIAEKNGRRIGLQCKLYSQPVGNKAIQEAHAGKVFHGLDAAGVISNATFTSSAKDLANVTGVKLLSHQHIPDLDLQYFGLA